MDSYTSETSSLDLLLVLLLGNTSVSASDDAAAGVAGLRLDEHAASFVTRIRPSAALAKEALRAEYCADAAARHRADLASRWARERLIYIGNEDGDSLLHVLPTCIIAKIGDAMNPRPHAAAPFSSSSHVNSQYGRSISGP